VNRRLTTWTAAIALAMTGAAGAQEQATVLKRDGTRVSGRFEAWNRNTNTLYIRVSLGDQRIIPLGDALVIDAEGDGQNLPETELGPARGGDHVLVTRAGEIIRGRMTNIEGGEGSGQDGEPRIVTFQASGGGERRVRFTDLRRLYLGNVPSSPGRPLPETPMPTGAIRVAGSAGWVGTNIIVGRNDRLQFTADGQVQLSADPEDRASPAGSLKGRYAPNGPAPTLLAGALLGRIGNGPAFAIGDQTQELPVPAAGQLFLAVNDDQAGDNQGAFAVTVRHIRRR